MSDRGESGPADPRVAAAIAALALNEPRITPLAGGPSNRSFRLQTTTEDLVLRLAGAEAEALGADAESEFVVHELAARAGLAPAIRLAWPAQGVLVTRHVAGRRPERDEMLDPSLLRRIGAWFARLHGLALPAGLATIDFGERAAVCLERLRHADDAPELAAIAERLERRRATLPAPARRAPCHHDLHHRNLVIDGDAILALDWEYAGPGDPAADLAACIRYHGLEAAQVDALIEGHGGGVPRVRVEALGWIFDCLWFGWLALAATQGLDADRRERDALARRLAV